MALEDSAPGVVAPPPDDDPRREVEKREWVRGEPDLAPERRSERQFVRVNLPLEVEHHGTTYRGFDISLSGFSVVGHPAIDDGVVDDFVLRLLFRGYALTVNVKATSVRLVAEHDLSGFRIVAIEDDQLEVLRKILRAYLGGQLVTLEGLLVAADSQTGRRGDSDAKTRPSGPMGAARWRRGGWYLGIAGMTCALMLVLAASLFERLAVVEASFAAVTAPKLEIRAPTDGEVMAQPLEPGDRVARDQLLVEVRDRDLEIELELARADFAKGQRLLEEPASPTDAAGLGEERATTLALERARLTALEHRLASNRLYAPCVCTVFWAAPGGDWVHKGDRLFTLVRSAPGDLLVEALVPLRSIDKIAQHYTAFVELPHSGELIEARVALIALDSERQPRAGFPRWAQEQQSLASVLLRPSQALPEDMIGVPVQVVFSRAPEITLTVANLKTRLRELAPEALAALGLSDRAMAREAL
jgi:mannuronan synthase